MLTHLDLFSGIGGFALVFQREGFRTTAFCEIDDYAQRTLIKNFGAVMADAVSTEQRRKPWESKAKIFADIRTLDGTQFRGVTVLTAGVPCQSASQAGKRRGAADDRWLWPEALRILRESLPAWAIFENPPGILTLEGGLVFERLLAQVESEGYSVQPVVIPACAVDAKHRRDRVWIVGHRIRADADSGNGYGRSGTVQVGRQRIAGQDAEGNGAHSRRELLERWGGEPAHGATQWEPEPGVGRVAHGVPNRVHRLRGLGNAVVPQVVQVIVRQIKEIEMSHERA